MKRQLVKPSTAALIGLALTMPALYFILISLLKYLFHFPALFNVSEPLFNALGAKEPLGWNINLLILFGPLLTFFLNLSAIASLAIERKGESFNLHLSFQRKAMNWVVLALSGGCLAILFLYALGENCTC